MFSRIGILTLAGVLALGAGVEAQIVLPGSTVEGDYLRGVGFAAMGMGSYNFNTAMANSINTDTAIKWNEYVSAVAEYQARKYAQRRERQAQERIQHHKAILQRIRENPEERDVQTGDTLNDLMKQLLDPSISESSYRSVEVPLSADVVRRIPFKLDKENVVFSMNRLTATGKEKWPPALQDPRFAAWRRSYQRALDHVLEEQIEGKMTIDSIKAVETAVDDLLGRLDEVLKPSNDKLYLEAKNRLVDFQKTTKLLLKSHRMEIVIGQLDQYAGTSVHDLLVFMQRNNLGFAGAESPDERGLYPTLHASLIQQRDFINGVTKKAAD